MKTAYPSGAIYSRFWASLIDILKRRVSAPVARNICVVSTANVVFFNVNCLATAWRRVSLCVPLGRYAAPIYRDYSTHVL